MLLKDQSIPRNPSDPPVPSPSEVILLVNLELLITENSIWNVGYISLSRLIATNVGEKGTLQSQLDLGLICKNRMSLGAPAPLESPGELDPNSFPQPGTLSFLPLSVLAFFCGVLLPSCFHMGSSGSQVSHEFGN